MKWLKQNSSDNGQISIAESQPEPEHISENAPEYTNAPAPATLEQLEVDEAMPEEAKSAQNSKQYSRRRESKNPTESKSDKKNTSSTIAKIKHSWIGQNWKTVAILLAIFCLGFFARAYYGLEPATENGFILSGGSDSYYHNYVITHATDTGEHHFWDNMLNYPVGTRNPRPPLYDWSVSLMGIGLSPFFDGDVFTSTFYVFLFSTAFWGALTVFPTYFLGKEAFGKKAGIIGAFLLAIMPGHIQRSVLTNADHDAITLFFMVTGFFFFLKALKIMEQREWITSWGKPKELLAGSKAFIGSNKASVLYSVLAGLSIAGVALIWQGFAYAIVLVSVYFFVQILINRFRNIDSFGISLLYFITVGVGLLVAFPYYYQSIQIASWFDTPTYFFLGLFAFALIMMATRKYPWFLVFSGIILAAAITVVMLYLLAPSVLDTVVNALLSGGGYFINNKQYQTIAEAQAPAFSNLALSFGVFTFWLSFIGLAWAAIQLPKSWKPDFTFILLWSGTAIYMAVTAARFMFNAGPAFAITAGWIVALIIEKIDFKTYVDNLKRAAAPNMTMNFKVGLLAAIIILLVLSMVLVSVSNFAYPVFVIGIAAICAIYMLNLIAETNPSRIYSFVTVMVPASGALFYILAEFYTEWVFTDATHVFILMVLLLSYFVLYIQVKRTSFFFTGGVLFLALCIVAPNVWAGLDAGIPYETKNDFDKQIYDAMPLFMQPADYDKTNGTTWFLGGFGYSLPLNSRYWPAAYDWLATQDTEIYPEYERPAFLSWWDYGFEVVNEGEHPTVADNFLGGHQLAGNFIMAQSEKDAIALLCVRILESDWNTWGEEGGFFSEGVLPLLDQYGLDATTLHHIYETPSDFVDEILSNPQIYGPRDDVIQDANAKYLAARGLITETLDEEEVVNFYHDLSEATGHSIRYFGIDSRLFPFSADNTGIFYAPAKLSDHRIDETANQPYDFWEIKAIGEYGGEYALDEIPDDVNLNQETPYKLVYKDMFYNSMLYKTFIGYSGSDIGSEEGIPGLTDALSSSPLMPGWNMTHFKLVHRTAYWNPYPAEEIQNHTDAWTAMNYWDAYEKQQDGDGISDLSDRSSIYQGVMILKYYDGATIHGKVTLEDGTPIQGITVTITDDFDIPHQNVITDKNGSYSLIAPFGDVKVTASSGSIDRLTMQGTVLNTTELHIEDYQAMRENADHDFDGVPDYIISQNLVISSGSISGKVYWDIDSDSTYTQSDKAVTNADISVFNNEISFKTSTNSDLEGNYKIEMLPPGSYIATITMANHTLGTQEITIVSGESSVTNIAIMVTPLTGTVTMMDGEEKPVEDAIVRLWMPEEHIFITAISDVNGAYTFDNVIPGNYSAQTIYYNYASPVQRLEISQSVNNTADFFISDSMKIEGVIRLNGVPVPYATIMFSGDSSYISTANSTGYFSIILNDGDYTYIAQSIKNGIPYSLLNYIYVNEDQTLDIDLKPACMVIGRVLDYNGFGASFAQVIFDSTETQISISATTDSEGDYSINVPQGIYRLQVSSKLYGSYYGMHDLTSQIQTVNLATKEGTLVSGTIFWDLIGNDAVDTDEGITNARVKFIDPSGIYAEAITNDTGNFSIVLVPTTSYTISIEKVGFQTLQIGTFTPAQITDNLIQNIQPITIPVTGSIFLNEEPLTDQNIMIKFTSVYDEIPSVETQAAHDGSYSVNLLPGIYSISFSHNITAGNDLNIYQIEEEITIDTGLYLGKTLHMDLTAVQRSKVIVKTSLDVGYGLNISFRFGPENRYFDMNGINESFYIMPGNYLLSALQAVNDTVKVDMQDVSVNNYSNLFEISLKDGVSLSGSISYGGNYVIDQKITFNDTSSSGTISTTTDETGVFNVVLLPNVQYEATVDFVNYDEESGMRAYRYYSTRLITTSTNQLADLPISLDRELFYTNVTGSVLSTTGVAPNTIVTFISEFGNFTTTSNSTGEFSISLNPAKYLMYAHQTSSHEVNLEDVYIDIEQEPLSVELQKGTRIYGTVYYDLNKNMETRIQFTDSSGISINITSNDRGYYETWLPAGQYDLTSTVIIVKNDVDITYSLDQTVDLITDRQLNLPLAMEEQRIVFVSYSPSQLKEIPANSTVVYTFEVENTGNIKDTYDVTATGPNTDWTTELSDSEVTLDAGVSATLSVTVRIPADARIEQNQVTITAISQKNNTIQHYTVMNLLIKQIYGFTIKPAVSTPIFTDGNISSKFTVSNVGNGADLLTLYIANNDDLSLNGWVAEFGQVSGAELLNDGKMIMNVSISSDGTSDVPIQITPTTSNPSRLTSVLIVGYSQNDENAIASNYIILKYPELQISETNLTVVGVGVSESESGDQIVNAGVMVISVASALILFYYARRKRWIR